MFEIFTSSIGADRQLKYSKHILMPFDKLEVGQSFMVSFNELFIKSESSFRSYVSKKGKDLGRKFSVIKRKEFNMYEVARVQ